MNRETDPFYSAVTPTARPIEDLKLSMITTKQENKAQKIVRWKDKTSAAVGLIGDVSVRPNHRIEVLFLGRFRVGDGPFQEYGSTHESRPVRASEVSSICQL